MSGSSSKVDTKDVMASIRRVIVDEVRDNPLARGPIADTSGAKRLVLGPALRVPGDTQYATQAVTEAVTEAASAMTSNLRPSEGGPRTGNQQDDPATTVDTSPEASGDDIYNMPVDNADAQDEPAPDNTSKKRRELVRGRRKEAPAVAEPSPQAPFSNAKRSCNLPWNMSEIWSREREFAPSGGTCGTVSQSLLGENSILAADISVETAGTTP